MKRFFILILATLLCHPALAAPQFNPLSVDWRQGERWQTRESEHFRIHFRSGDSTDPATEAWVRHTADLAEAVHQRLSQELDWQPGDKTELVLSDNYDLANGWASALPFNQSRLLLSPPDRFNSLENNRDWLETLIIHEYTHVLHLDKGHQAPQRLRRFFGRLPLLFPNQFQPTFMIEGLAIHKESEPQAQLGRAYSALYEGEIRAQLEAGLRSLSQVSVSNRRWPGGDGYLYGAFFFRFLSERYGEEKIEQLIHHYSSNLLPFALNRTTRQVYGKDMASLWQEYQHWLTQHFAADANGPAGQRLTHHGLHNHPPVAGPDGLYRIIDDGHRQPQLVRYQGEQHHEITRLRNPGLFDINRQGEVIIASLRQRRENRLWSDLYLYNGQRWQRLTDDGRYREARWLDSNTLVARRIVNGIAELHLLSRDGEAQGLLWQGEPGQVLGQFSLHPSGQHLVAAFKPTGRSWQLARIQLSDGQLELLTDNARIQGEPSHGQDGQLYFSADYGGRFNLYRWRQSQAPEQLSQVNSAAFSPVAGADGQLYYQHLSAVGHDLWRQPLNHTLGNADEQISSALSTPVDTASRPALPRAHLSEAQPYRPWRSLRPRWWLPVLSITDDSVLAGISTAGSDSLGQHNYALTLAYENRSEEPSGFASYQFSNRYQLFAERSLSFSSLDDQIVRVRASDTVSLTRLNLWNGWDDFLELRPGLFYERDSDRFVDPALSPFVDRQRGLLGAALIFDNRQHYRYSISPASGRRLALVAETNEAIRSDFSGEVYALDWREYWHLGRSQVLALRTTGSWGSDASKPIRLGDHHGESLQVFGRDRYLLRGYPDNQITGRRAALASLEWRFPLARIQRNWHTYPLGLRDLHGALLSDTGAVWNSPDGRRDDTAYSSLGAELTTELALGYNLILPLRLGIARGLDSELGETRAYLSLGGSF